MTLLDRSLQRTFWLVLKMSPRLPLEKVQRRSCRLVLLDHEALNARLKFAQMTLTASRLHDRIHETKGARFVYPCPSFARVDQSLPACNSYGWLMKLMISQLSGVNTQHRNQARYCKWLMVWASAQRYWCELRDPPTHGKFPVYT